MRQVQTSSGPNQQVSFSPALPTEIADSSRSQANLVRLLFSAFNGHAIRYCVLHSWEGLPEKGITSDLDLAVDSKDLRKMALIFKVLGEIGYEVVQCIEYEVNAYCFIVVWWEGKHLRSLAIDIVTEQWVNGIVMPPERSILVGRRLYRGFWIASPEVEFAYLLAKRMSKGSVDAVQGERLRFLAKTLSTATVSHAAKALTFGSRTNDLVNACMKADFSCIGPLGKRMCLVGLLRHPILFCRHATRNLARLLRRWLHPTGLLIAVLGPDGVGKSTLVRKLASELQDVFRGLDRFHWRPSLLRNRSQTITDCPHLQTPRRQCASLAVLFAVIVDNWLGYLFVIREALARTHLVLFDRCYWDVLVDPIRYRYGGPLRVAKWLARLLPPPDIFILMDAPEEVVLSRKREISKEELARQREEYLHFCAEESRAFAIDATRPAELVCFSSVETVLRYLLARFQDRYPQWTYRNVSFDSSSSAD